MFVRLEDRIVRGTEEDREVQIIHGIMDHVLVGMPVDALLAPNESLISRPSPWGGEIHIINRLSKIIGVTMRVMDDKMLLFVAASSGSGSSVYFPGGDKNLIEVLPMTIDRKDLTSGSNADTMIALLEYQRCFKIASRAEAIERYRHSFNLHLHA